MGFTPLKLLVSLCVLATFAQASTDYGYCDKRAEYVVNVSKVEIHPSPVARGEQATFNISATSAGAISAGKLVVEVSYFGFHIHTESHDLCEVTSCPVSGGDFIVSHSQVLPGYTPPGSYTLKMKLEDDKGHQLTCISFDFSIGFVSSVADL